MDLVAGSEYIIAFVIDDRSVLCHTIFTGEYVEVNDEKCYLLENKNNGRVYAFTKEMLTECKGLNDESSRGSVDVLSI